MRIVFDTASFITAVRSSDGAAGEILRMIFRREIVPLMDLNLGLEYRHVAQREEHISASGLTRSEMVELIEAVEAFAEPVVTRFKFRPLSSDPNDDMVLDIAINGHADALITRNAKHFTEAAKGYGIPVYSPGEFLQRLRKVGRYGI